MILIRPNTPNPCTIFENLLCKFYIEVYTLFLQSTKIIATTCFQSQGKRYKKIHISRKEAFETRSNIIDKVFAVRAHKIFLVKRYGSHFPEQSACHYRYVWYTVIQYATSVYLIGSFKKVIEIGIDARLYLKQACPTCPSRLTDLSWVDVLGQQESRRKYLKVRKLICYVNCSNLDFQVKKPVRQNKKTSSMLSCCRLWEKKLYLFLK